VSNKRRRRTAIDHKHHALRLPRARVDPLRMPQGSVAHAADERDLSPRRAAPMATAPGTRRPLGEGATSYRECALLPYRSTLTRLAMSPAEFARYDRSDEFDPHGDQPAPAEGHSDVTSQRPACSGRSGGSPGMRRAAQRMRSGRQPGRLRTLSSSDLGAVQESARSDRPVQPSAPGSGGGQRARNPCSMPASGS